MKSGIWQRRAALFLLIVYSLDLLLKLADWRESFGELPWWGIALRLTFRFAFMGFLLFLYLKLRKGPQEPTVVTLAARNAAVRSMRVLHIVFLLAIVGYLYVAERFLHSTNKVQISFVASFSIVTVAMAAIAFAIRRRLLASAINGLRRNASDAEALGRWRTATLFSMVMALSISMCGLALRAIGGSREIAWPFFLFSIFLMVLWTPRLNDEHLAPDVSSGPEIGR